MSEPATLVTVYARDVVQLADLPHGSLAVTLETSAGRTAVILDRGALSLVAREAGRIQLEAGR